MLMVYYELKPEYARVEPSFRPGIRYPELEPPDAIGYAFVELHGRRRAIDTRHFDRLEGSQNAGRSHRVSR